MWDRVLREEPLATQRKKFRQLTTPFVLCTIGLCRDVDPAICSSVSIDDVKGGQKNGFLSLQLGP